MSLTRGFAEPAGAGVTAGAGASAAGGAAGAGAGVAGAAGAWGASTGHGTKRDGAGVGKPPAGSTTRNEALCTPISPVASVWCHASVRLPAASATIAGSQLTDVELPARATDSCRSADQGPSSVSRRSARTLRGPDDEPTVVV